MPKKNQDPYKEIADNYDMLFRNRDEISEIQRIVKKFHPKAKSILELACGTGALLSPFSKTHQVSGLDVSNPMLSVARKRIPKGKFYHQDMTKFSLKKKFDVILCLFNSLNHLADFSELKNTFLSARKHLNTSGILIFDINTPTCNQTLLRASCSR